MIIQVGKVISSSIRENKDRKIKSRILQVEITSKKDVQSVEYFSSFGDDSVPPPGSEVIILALSPSWKIAIASRAQIEPESYGPGDYILRSTDSAGNTVQALIRLKANGNIELIPSSGVIEVTGVIQGSTVFNGANSDEHVHSAGTPTAPLILDSLGNPCTGATGPPQ